MRRQSELTEAMAHAAASDAANRQMRKAGRTAWSREDFDLAVNTFEELYGWGNPERSVNSRKPSPCNCPEHQ